MIQGLSDRLRELRLRNCYSQKQVAITLRVSPAIISGYETGERTPSTENLLALSYLYHCSTDYLLGKERPQSSNLIDVTGLSAEQVRILTELVSSMR